jgi:imidazolonepropionase-like amidohydrolase
MRYLQVILGGLALAYSIATWAGAAENTVVLSAAKVYTAPDAESLEDAVILIRNGKIAKIESHSQSAVPERKLASDCENGIVLAGFQNSHVHFIEDAFSDANNKSAAALSEQIERMLTRFGFTTVVDMASDLKNTLAIRHRIANGEVRGPRILTAGAGVFPPDGLPVYISYLPKQFLDAQLMPRSAEEARRMVRQNLDQGADATKLFVATPQADHSVKRMSLEIARAAVEATHAENKLVMVHPTDTEGFRLALAAKADVLVHTTLGEEAPWPDDVLHQLLNEGVTIAPTFKLLGYELQKQHVPADISQHLIAKTVENFKPFVAGGGKVIFGTDVGYMTDYDPTEEYVLMQQAGMSPMQILASLTTQPAALWNEAARRGRVAAGMDADLVVLAADPAQDVRRFADVRCAVRGGKVIYRKTM